MLASVVASIQLRLRLHFTKGQYVLVDFSDYDTMSDKKILRGPSSNRNDGRVSL
jgi:hypothetical protein